MGLKRILLNILLILSSISYFSPTPKKEKIPENLSHSWTAEGINAFQKKCGAVHKVVSYHVFKPVPLWAADNRKADMEWELSIGLNILQ